MSGPAMTQTQVAIAILQTGGWAYQSQPTIAAMVTWFAREGGAGPQWGIPGNINNYNPLGTTLKLPGSVDEPGNNPPTQSYISWAQGIQATTLTLQENQRGYAGIRAVLAAGGDCLQLSAAVAASAWGTPSFAGLCGNVPLPTGPIPPTPGSNTGWVVGAVGWGAAVAPTGPTG